MVLPLSLVIIAYFLIYCIWFTIVLFKKLRIGFCYLFIFQYHCIQIDSMRKCVSGNGKFATSFDAFIMYSSVMYATDVLFVLSAMCLDL